MSFRKRRGFCRSAGRRECGARDVPAHRLPIARIRGFRRSYKIFRKHGGFCRSAGRRECGARGFLPPGEPVEQRGELQPARARRLRHRLLGEQRAARRRGADVVEHAPGGLGANAGEELDGAEAGDAVARVLGPAQQREHVLDVGGLEEPEPAVLHEGNIAPGQLQLQARAVRRGAEQHRLLLELEPFLAARQHAVDHEVRLRRLVLHRHQTRALRRGALAPQVLGEALGGERDHRVGGVEDGLGGAVVALQRHHPRRWREGRREVEDVAHRGSAEGVDRLRVVADHGQATAIGLHREQDRGLQRVGVLVFVDQHVVEEAADLGAEAGIGHHLRPVQQQVVVVEHLLGLLGVDVGAEQALERVLPLRAPREARLQHLGERGARIDHRRVDRQAGALLRKTLLRRRQPELVAHQVHQVGGVLAVVDAEAGIEPDAAGVVAQQARADGVEGARPRQLRARQAGAVGGGLREDAAHAPAHLVRRAAREGQQQDAPGVGAGGDQAGHAVRERAGLARAGAGDHQQRPGVDAALGADAVLDRGALGGVERGERIGDRQLRGIGSGAGRGVGPGGRTGVRTGVGRGKGLDRDHHGCKYIQPRRAPIAARTVIAPEWAQHRSTTGDPRCPPPTPSCRAACSRAA